MKTVVATAVAVLFCVGARADELNDMPDIACARASSAVERDHIGCPGTDRAAASPLDRAEDD